MTTGAGVPDADTAARYRDGLQRWLPTQIDGARALEVDGLEPISSVGGARRPWRFDVRCELGGHRHAGAVRRDAREGARGQLETVLGPEFAALRVLHTARRPRGASAVDRS